MPWISTGISSQTGPGLFSFEIFTVTGGGSMFLNDAIGRNSKIKKFYLHNEQACSMAAEAYAKFRQKPALVCVTTGPGGINAINGVFGAFTDSVPNHYELNKDGYYENRTINFI